MKIKNTILAMLICSVGLFSQENWTVDRTHSDIRFTVTHMTISEVDGQFMEFDGTVTNAGEDFAGANVEFIAKTASVETDSDRRNNHLKSADFFDAENNPDITFKGNIQKDGEKYYLVGDFTLKGVTKPIKFDAKYFGKIPGGRGAKAGFKVTGEIDRFEFDVKWDRALDTGGLVVGKKVQITCNVELNEQRSSGQ